jgi:signal transduction histidine kinase
MSVMFGLGLAAAVTGRGGWLLVVLLLLVVGSGMRRGYRHAWAPARDLARAAGRLADGDYSVRVDAGPGPTRPLAGSFNRMAERLELEDQRRRRLLADLGHELRTPLSVIRGQVEAMIDGVHPSDGEHLEALLDEVGVMERLLEDLRTLTLAEAGRLALHREETDLVGLIEDVLALHREPGVEMAVEGTAPPIEVDPVRIRQVLTNLVTNSIRYMPDGGQVTVKVTSHPGRVQVSVEDTGPGIPAEILPQIFERFTKSKDSTGSGLGLTIARNLVEAHGGSIRAESTGKGTTIAFELPTA